MPTLKEISDAAWKPVLVAVTGALIAYGSGMWQDTKVSAAFYGKLKPEEVKVTLFQVQEFMSTAKGLGEEFAQFKQVLNTKVGLCRVYDTEDHMTALINRRSPWKKQDLLVVTDLDGEEKRSISVTVVGDFQDSTETYWIQVSPDAGRALGIPRGKSIRAEVRPEK